MSQLAKRFSDGSFLEYDDGSFDKWCVFLTDASGHRSPPRDTDYFAQLKALAGQFGTDKVYGDYVKIYDMTGTDFDGEVMDRISALAKGYKNSSLQVDTVFSILYMAMIAEENKANTRLGKRIKRLGIHKLLMEDDSVQNAANFMRGMKWPEIDRLCKKRGF